MCVGAAIIFNVGAAVGCAPDLQQASLQPGTSEPSFLQITTQSTEWTALPSVGHIITQPGGCEPLCGHGTMHVSGFMGPTFPSGHVVAIANDGTAVGDTFSGDAVAGAGPGQGKISGRQ